MDFDMTDEAIAKLLIDLDLPPSVMHTMAKVLSEPSIMASHGVSPHLERLAAEIHKEYVKLLNLFCKIQDKDGRDGWATERDEKNRMSRGLSVEDWKAYKAAAPQMQAGQGLEMKDLKGKEDRGAGRGSEFSFENPMRARPSKVHAKSMSGEFSDGEVSSSSEEEGEGNDPPPPPGAPPPAGG